MLSHWLLIYYLANDKARCKISEGMMMVVAMWLLIYFQELQQTLLLCSHIVEFNIRRHKHACTQFDTAPGEYHSRFFGELVEQMAMIAAMQNARIKDILHAVSSDVLVISWRNTIYSHSDSKWYSSLVVVFSTPVLMFALI
jgi:hypothetical protein